MCPARNCAREGSFSKSTGFARSFRHRSVHGLPGFFLRSVGRGDLRGLPAFSSPTAKLRFFRSSGKAHYRDSGAVTMMRKPVMARASVGRWTAARQLSAIAALVFVVAGRFWTPLTIVTVCYYFGGVLALGNSPGSWLVGRPHKNPAIGRRQTRLRPQPAARTLHGAANLSQFKPRHYTKAG